jgi:hypothetical protein
MVSSPSRFLFVGDSFLAYCDLVCTIGKSGGVSEDLASPPPKIGGASIGCSNYDYCTERLWRLLRVSYLFYRRYLYFMGLGL